MISQTSTTMKTEFRADEFCLEKVLEMIRGLDAYDESRSVCSLRLNDCAYNIRYLSSFRLQDVGAASENKCPRATTSNIHVLDSAKNVPCSKYPPRRGGVVGLVNGIGTDLKAR